MKYFFTTLMIFLVMSAEGFCQETLVPEYLPKRWNKPEVKEALTRWASVRGSRPQSFVVTEYESANEKWLQVYFKMHFFHHDPTPKKLSEDDTLIAPLLNQIYSTLDYLNRAGHPIKVHFEADFVVEDLITNIMLVSQKTNKVTSEVRNSVETIEVHVYAADDSFWDNRGENWGFTSHNKNSIYLRGFLAPLTHEMTHALLNNNDAYYYNEGFCAWLFNKGVSEVDSKLLIGLNANCSMLDIEKIDPIEIFIGLKAQGYEAPGWEKYVYWNDRKDMTAEAGLNNSIRVLDQAFRRSTKALFKLEVYNSKGQIVYTLETKRSELSNTIDLNHLSEGTYAVNATLGYEDFILAENNFKITITHN